MGRTDSNSNGHSFGSPGGHMSRPQLVGTRLGPRLRRCGARLRPRLSMEERCGSAGASFAPARAIAGPAKRTVARTGTLSTPIQQAVVSAR